MASSPHVKKTKIQPGEDHKAGSIYKGEQLLHQKNSVALHSPPDMKYHNFEHKQKNAYRHLHLFSINLYTVLG